ncbi:MAG: IPT/TIG domain-containing protein, partial [Bryobacteraceae bacterium]|nr:IPT/TIG domain-containing protein [Bryobacteraceae bacterium]
ALRLLRALVGGTLPPAVARTIVDRARGNPFYLNELVATLRYAGTLLVDAQAAFPRMTAVEPTNGKAGDVLNVTGENLGKENVAQVFLTDGKNDFKVEITEQAETAIKFKIPANIKPGRFSLMVLTTGSQPKLIEQPVKVTVE